MTEPNKRCPFNAFIWIKPGVQEMLLKENESDLEGKISDGECVEFNQYINSSCVIM